MFGLQFKVFSLTTTGSKLSIPKAATLPSVQYLTIAFVISIPLLEITLTGLTLSMCNTVMSGHCFLIVFNNLIGSSIE